MFPRLKQQGREAKHSLPFSGGEMNEWSYVLRLLLQIFLSYTGTTLPLKLPLPLPLPLPVTLPCDTPRSINHLTHVSALLTAVYSILSVCFVTQTN